MTLQDAIKKYREEHDLTMQAFASRCGLSKGYISMLESGKHPQSRRAIVPSIETYLKLASGMGISLDELLGQIEPSSMARIGLDEDYGSDTECGCDYGYDADYCDDRRDPGPVLAEDFPKSKLTKDEKKLINAWRSADDKTRRKVAIDLEDYGFSYNPKNE